MSRLENEIKKQLDDLMKAPNKHMMSIADIVTKVYLSSVDAHPLDYLNKISGNRYKGILDVYDSEMIVSHYIDEKGKVKQYNTTEQSLREYIKTSHRAYGKVGVTGIIILLSTINLEEACFSLEKLCERIINKETSDVDAIQGMIKDYFNREKGIVTNKDKVIKLVRDMDDIILSNYGLIKKYMLNSDYSGEELVLDIIVDNKGKIKMHNWESDKYTDLN